MEPSQLSAAAPEYVPGHSSSHNSGRGGRLHSHSHRGGPKPSLEGDRYNSAALTAAETPGLGRPSHQGRRQSRIDEAPGSSQPSSLPLYSPDASVNVSDRGHPAPGRGDGSDRGRGPRTFRGRSRGGRTGATGDGSGNTGAGDGSYHVTSELGTAPTADAPPPGLTAPPQEGQRQRHTERRRGGAAAARRGGDGYSHNNEAHESLGAPHTGSEQWGAGEPGAGSLDAAAAPAMFRGGRGGGRAQRGGGRAGGGRGRGGGTRHHDDTGEQGIEEGTGLGGEDSRRGRGRRGGGLGNRRGGRHGGGPPAVEQERGPSLSAPPAADRGSEGGGGSCSESECETLTCVICCEEVTAVALGACGHSHTCARCCLRLRLCYRDLRCPLCKAVNEEVVVARPPLPPGASFEALAGAGAGAGAAREALWQQPRWARGVLVYEGGQAGQQQGPPRRVRPLHRSLQALTSRSCSECDGAGRRPFGTMNLLMGHIRSAHDRALCEVCVGAGLRFPLEYPAYTAAQLGAHQAAEHPRCEYCCLPFYGRDELYAHMTQRHFTCHVCSRLGRHHLYFPDADSLLVHLLEAHFACDHPECAGCMIAFASRDELSTHIREQHSAHMPRWDQSRARPMLLDFIAPRGLAAAAAAGPAAAGAASASEGRNGSGGRQRGGAGARRGRGEGAAAAAAAAASSTATAAGGLEDPEAFPSLGAAPPPQQPAPAGLGDLHEGEGGLAVIDDDLGMGMGMGLQRGAAAGAGPAAALAPAAGGGAPGAPPSGAGVRLAGAWAGRQPGSQAFGEDFPELSAIPGAAWGGAGPARSAWGTGPRPAAASPPRAASSSFSSLPQGLRKVTVRCPCGRRVDHLALREEQPPPPLACDRQCTAAQRRSQLADAFGVAEADSHVSYFDRHRTPAYPPELVQAAHAAGLEWVSSLEQQLAAFLAAPALRRTSLPPGMSQAQRRLVHELAGHYGLASHSAGQGSSRAVQLLRGTSSGVPTRLLSAVAVAVGPEELAALQAGAQAGGGGWALRLVDVAPGANVHHYLRPWEGEYTLSSAPPSSSSSSSSSLLLTFSREAAFRDCCATLAGGVRGVFRTAVERNPQRQPGQAAAGGARAAEPPPAPPPGWQVLRNKASSSASAARKAGGAAAVRAALAADAWDSGDEAPGQQHVQQGAGERSAAAASYGTATGAGAAVSEARLPGRGPPLDLAGSTLWSALSSEEGDGAGEGAAGGGGGGQGAGSGGNVGTGGHGKEAGGAIELAGWEEELGGDGDEAEW